MQFIEAAQVQQYQKNGQKLSEYDIEVLQKKYELEKARAELEEAREAKTTVRLQRNRDGSWGYVYTADEDKLDELQANLEEAIYKNEKMLEKEGRQAWNQREYRTLLLIRDFEKR